MRNSKQRNEILKTVINSCDHPNAETIYTRVKKDLPNISLGTVYRNLCLLSRQGMVRQVCTTHGADRYDKTLAEHAHFYCRECGELSDIEYDLAATDIFCNVTAKSGHSVDGIELMFSGVCKNCQKTCNKTTRGG